MKKIIIILLLVCLCGCYQEKYVDLNSINEIDDSNASNFDFDLYSKEYLLLRVSDLKIINKKNEDKRIYPASLTKLATLATVLKHVDNLDETSSFSGEQYQALIDNDASIAYLKIGKEYSIRDLLYALVLPSGADAAVCLENYFNSNGMSLIDEINTYVKQLGCNDTNFVNTTGLHDDNHYTTINDLLKIVLDILSNDEGRQIIETLKYTSEDGMVFRSSIRLIGNGSTQILGGKTGFTTESGQSLIVLFKKNNRSYILLMANAMGDPYNDEHFHFDDAVEIINYLY